jgi:hypothetical protein
MPKIPIKLTRSSTVRILAVLIAVSWVICLEPSESAVFSIAITNQDYDHYSKLFCSFGESQRLRRRKTTAPALTVGENK